MKCPKCAYLGFDTGERCRNCGYDFSLIADAEPAADLSIRSDDDVAPSSPWLEAVDRGLMPSAPASSSTSAAAMTQAAAAAALNFEPVQPPPSFRGEPVLPLFGSPAAGDDEPLIKVPSPPRPPLAVRRTPDTPRLRAVPKPVERVVEPKLDFAEDPSVSRPEPRAMSRESRTQPEELEVSGAGRRLVAAAIDHGILLGIDAVILYLTLRIASLTMSEWTALPMLPMLTFLGLLKLAYFTAFTCVGGQTIGKMAARIRVVSDDRQPIDAAHAIHRALAGAVSFLVLGAGFVPALVGSDRRALHDRLAHTRVVTLPAA